MNRSKRLLVGAAVGSLVVAVSGYWLVSSEGEPTATQTNLAVHDALVAEGQTSDVAECVVRLGADQIERDQYDAVLEAELLSACVAAQEGLDSDPGEATGDNSTDALAYTSEDEQGRPDKYGDDDSLDQLWDGCRQGSGEACDALFAVAPFDSVYEEFGLTCGQRPDVLRCTDLDQADEGPVPEVYVRGQEGTDSRQ